MNTFQGRATFVKVMQPSKLVMEKRHFGALFQRFEESLERDYTLGDGSTASKAYLDELCLSLHKMHAMRKLDERAH